MLSPSNPAALALGLAALGAAALATAAGPAPALAADPVAPALAKDPLFPEFGNGGYDVGRYALELDVDKAHNLKGRAVINARAGRALPGLMLDLSGLTVDSVRVNGAAATFSQSDGKLRVRPARAIEAGAKFAVVVAYHGTPRAIPDPSSDDPGILPLGWINRGAGVSYVVSEPVGAGSWYPVNDVPFDKATYSFAITVDKPLTAVANGTPGKVVDQGTRRRFTFEMAKPMASYLATVQIARYQTELLRSGSGVPVRIHKTPTTPQSEVEAFRATPAMIDYFESLVGKYPFATYGEIVVDDPDLYYALETQTVSTFPNSAGYDESVVAHELAHQWFGDAITVGMWRDLWLAEGFATYLELSWDHHGDPAGFDAAMRALYASAVRRGLGPVIVTDPLELFSDSVYDRGALTLQALRLKVGDKAFFRILRAYYAKFRYGNAESSDFIDLAVAQAGDVPGVRRLLRDWLYEEAVPALADYDRNAATAAASAAHGPADAPGVRRRR